MSIKLKDVTVIGAGTMGHALALVHALGGCNVSLQDVSPAALEHAEKLIAAALSTLEEAGEIDAGQSKAGLKRIRFSDSLAEVAASADLVVEAVVEDPAVKRMVFADIDRHAPASAIIASNTSYLDVFPLIPRSRQARSAIAHWYTPPYIIGLVDIAPGPETEPETIHALQSMYAGFGKVPLVFEKLIPGYVANRLQAALNLECLRIIDEGWATPEAIDQSIIHGLVTRLAVLGHVKKMDFTGLEMVSNSLASGMYVPPENTGESLTLAKHIRAGRTGIRAGAGFYDYGDTPAKELLRQRDLQLLKVKTEIAATREGKEDDHG